MYEQKQPLVPHSNLKNVMVVAFKFHANFSVAMLTWDDTEKEIWEMLFLFNTTDSKLSHSIGHGS